MSILFALELKGLHSSGITKQSVVNDMARVVLRIVFDVYTARDWTDYRPCDQSASRLLPVGYCI